jgi:hypothetical protein
VLSPGWPVNADFVKRAHDAGKPVVPYTFNKTEDVQAAMDVGVDAVIVNDVLAAQDAVYGTDCVAAQRAENTEVGNLKRARRARARARGAARTRAAAEVRRVNAERQKAKRLRLRVCTPGV